MAKENSNSEKSMTAETFRKRLEDAAKNNSGFPVELRLTAAALWKHIPTDLLPLLPQLSGVTFLHTEEKTSEQPFAKRESGGWGLPERELKVRFEGPSLKGTFTLYEGGTLKETTESLHQALYLLTE